MCGWKNAESFFLCKQHLDCIFMQYQIWRVSFEKSGMWRNCKVFRQRNLVERSRSSNPTFETLHTAGSSSRATEATLGLSDSPSPLAYLVDAQLFPDTLPGLSAVFQKNHNLFLAVFIILDLYPTFCRCKSPADTTNSDSTIYLCCRTSTTGIIWQRQWEEQRQRWWVSVSSTTHVEYSLPTRRSFGKRERIKTSLWQAEYLQLVGTFVVAFDAHKELSTIDLGVPSMNADVHFAVRAWSVCIWFSLKLLRRYGAAAGTATSATWFS